MNNFGLAGRSVLVTGSTSGIGEGIAAAFAEAGAKVLRHGMQSTGAPDVLVRDLLDPRGAEGLIEDAFAREAGLDLLICNAGSFFDAPFLEMDRSQFEKTFRLNVEQAYFLIQGFARRLAARQRSGAVVIVSSTNGFQAEEDSTAYDISKGALVMMTRTLALALGPQGIRVNGIAPGLIRTPLTSGWMDARPDLVEHYKRKILLGEIGTPADCGGACVFLCSEAARYIVGQTLVIDGGLTTGQIGRLAS